MELLNIEVNKDIGNKVNRLVGNKRKKKKPREKKLANQTNIKGMFEKCKKCDNLMERREHKEITEKQLSKYYYFSEWDYCHPYKGGCGNVQLYEKFKIVNRKGRALEEYQQTLTHFNNI